MPITQFHENFLPLLRHFAAGRKWPLAAPAGPILDEFGLTDADQAELLPSVTQSRFVNRLCWAQVHLERAGLIPPVRRGVFTISDAGRALSLGSMTSNPHAASAR